MSFNNFFIITSLKFLHMKKDDELLVKDGILNTQI